jgi:hypothetical protein
VSGKNYRGTRFSRYDDKGMDNSYWKGATVDRLMEFLADPEKPTEDKKLAAEILTFCAERKKNDPKGVADFLNDLDSSCLWEWPDHWQLKDVTGQDGTTIRQCVCVQEFIPLPIKLKSTVRVAGGDDEL